MNAEFCYSREVAHALAHNQPVVALESTIITHGMPYPQNLGTAQRIESLLRQHNVTPATIAVIDRRVHVGLTTEQLTRLAKTGDAAHKVSRRDLAAMVARGGVGATTVSATMLIAHRAGIHVFVTGGIGGVHRGAAASFDESADLAELGRTPVAVVCAGVKSILDIALTMERLESYGVTVVGFGVDEMPAFFTRRSGLRVPLRLDSAAECARLLDSNLALRLNSGVLIAVPVPEHEAANARLIEDATQRALREAQEQRVAGRDITPFLLARVAELTENASLTANIALVLNNARVGAAIAVELARARAPAPSVVCVGGLVCDIIARPGAAVVRGDSNPGNVAVRAGGVARNVAASLAALKQPVALISAVGGDALASVALHETREAGVDVSGVLHLPAHSTAVYNAMVQGASGELDNAVADMHIFEAAELRAHICATLTQRKPRFVLFDGNCDAQTLQEGVRASKAAAADAVVWFEPTSVAKCLRILPVLASVDFITPNRAELDALARAVDAESSDPAQQALELVQNSRVGCVIATLGADGVVMARKTNNYGVQSRHFPAIRIAADAMNDVTGAGDQFAGAFIQKFTCGASIDDAIEFGIEKATLHLTKSSSKL